MIPPCTDFSPHGAPPGVAVNFSAMRGADGKDWYRSRPIIWPRLQLVHTNGASREGSLQSQINHANANPAANTHPHYAVNAPQPTKLVPSNRKGIGNYKVADWSLVIETADAGWPTPGNLGGFLYDHAEIVARILAYESIVSDSLGVSMPLDYPNTWNGAGTAAHTEPFAYPYWSNSVGKACPGDTKKSQLRQLILPRARVLRAAWLNPQPPEDDLLMSELIKIDNGTALYERSGHIVTHVSVERWLAMGAPLTRHRFIDAAEARTLTITGPYPPEHKGRFGDER